MFQKILIANRGEIACRIIRTARRLGIATVAVYSDADARALHVRQADEAVRIGPPASRESYLRGDIIIAAARDTGAQAIHPGYGFLSENAGFAAACAAAGIVFIGPGPEAIDSMGLKDRAKDIMRQAGVPVVPGYMGEKQDTASLKAEAEKTGYPLLIKAVAGGGGKGMRLVERPADFEFALIACMREAENAFGNNRVMLEKFITKPRHVEVQVFGDAFGNAVYLHERDCSLQRRHQKVVEEAPAPGLPDDVRRQLGEAAVRAVKAIGYRNAGTIEFIMDSKTHEFYFMEMNTRLQVEHPVTEMITGLDLVEWQLRVAVGEPLPLAQKDIPCNGHAFEVRLYAEDPAAGFLPQAGRITTFIQAGQARTDTGVTEDDDVTIHYDPMIAKLIVHGADRDQAINAMRSALSETILTGLVTNQEFLGHIFRHPAFVDADVDTGFITRHEKDLLPDDYGVAAAQDIVTAASLIVMPGQNEDDIWAKGDNWRLNGAFTKSFVLVNRGKSHNVTVVVDGADYKTFIDGQLAANDTAENVIIVDEDGRDITIFRDGRVIRMHRPAPGEGVEGGAGAGRIVAPMPGKIIDVMVSTGAMVTKDQPLLVMEAMKMQMTIRAAFAGVIGELPVTAGQQVADGSLLVSIEQNKDAA